MSVEVAQVFDTFTKAKKFYSEFCSKYGEVEPDNYPYNRAYFWRIVERYYKCGMGLNGRAA